MQLQIIMLDIIYLSYHRLIRRKKSPLISNKIVYNPHILKKLFSLLNGSVRLRGRTGAT